MTGFATAVSLDSFVERELPVKLPELRRKRIIRLRGQVVDVEPARQDGTILTYLGDVDKPLAFTHRLAIPPVGDLIQTICTEGAAWYFTKWWKSIELSGYKLRSDETLENMVLNVLASMPDERILADDLHTAEIEAYMLARAKALGKEKAEPRILGAVLASLGNQGIIAPVLVKLENGGHTALRLRSVRPQNHHRPDLKVWTWAYNDTGP